MKKFGRIIWIAVLSAVAFMVACVSSKGLTKTDVDRTQLIKERDSLQRVLKQREGACVYGPPEIIQAYGDETNRLRHQLDSINNLLGEDEPK